MTINEAVEILQDFQDGNGGLSNIGGEKAIQLGIEALKWFNHIREADLARANVKLPSE